MNQPSFFAERVRSALCCYEQPCGYFCVLGEPELRGEAMHQDLTCEHCGRTGNLSVRCSADREEPKS